MPEGEGACNTDRKRGETDVSPCHSRIRVSRAQIADAHAAWLSTNRIGLFHRLADGWTDVAASLEGESLEDGQSRKLSGCCWTPSCAVLRHRSTHTGIHTQTHTSHLLPKPRSSHQYINKLTINHHVSTYVGRMYGTCTFTLPTHPPFEVNPRGSSQHFPIIGSCTQHTLPSIHPSRPLVHPSKHPSIHSSLAMTTAPLSKHTPPDTQHPRTQTEQTKETDRSQ